MKLSGELISVLSDKLLDPAVGLPAAEVIADILDASYPKIAQRLWVSLAFPDVPIALPDDEKNGLFRDIWGVRDGTFIPGAAFWRREPDQATSLLCRGFLHREAPGPEWPDFALLGSGQHGFRFRRAAIRHTMSGDENLRELLASPAFAGLEDLEFACDSLGFLVPWDSRVTGVLRGLRRLRLRAHRLSLRGCKLLLADAVLTSLESLELTSMVAAEALPGMLERPGHLPSLRTLHLDVPALDAQRVEALCGWERMASLESLELTVPWYATGNWLGPVISTAVSLRHLGLRAEPDTCPGLLEPLFSGPLPPGLTSLRLAGLHLEERLAGRIADHATVGRLRRLGLDRCGLNRGALSLLGEAVLPRLESFAFQPQVWHPRLSALPFGHGSECLSELDLLATNPGGLELGSWVPPRRFPSLMRLSWHAGGPRGLFRFAAAAGQLRLVNDRFID
jgi:hypothetical protein